MAHSQSDHDLPTTDGADDVHYPALPTPVTDTGYEALLATLGERPVGALEQLERKGGQSGIPVYMRCGDLATTWTLIDGAVRCEDCADVDFRDAQ